MLVIGYAKSSKEFDVEADLTAMGIQAEVARKIEYKRQGKRRYADAITEPDLPNYVFIECTADQWHQLASVKHLAKTTIFVGPQEARRVRDYLDASRAAYDRQREAQEAGERVSEFKAGDTLQIMSGPLAGCLARFRRIVETDHDPFPRIQAEGELMGRIVTVDVDPIHARKAG